MGLYAKPMEGQELLSFLAGGDGKMGTHIPGKMGTHIPGKMGTRVPIFPSSQENGDPGSPFYHKDGEPIGENGHPQCGRPFSGIQSSFALAIND